MYVDLFSIYTCFKLGESVCTFKVIRQNRLIKSEMLSPIYGSFGASF